MPTPTAGNRFEYYVPRVVGAKPMPVSVTVPPAKPKYLKPAAFIRGSFKVATHVPFGSGGALPASQVIDDIEVVRAALEAGYGPRSSWTSALVVKPHEAVGLTNYLLMRLEMALACVEWDGANARAMTPFYERIEASEKVALSFILGGIGAYLAARQWLGAGNDSLSAFLHTGIFTKGINGLPKLVHFLPDSGKWPDYLVYTRNGDWHVFESKGGTAGSRWGRLVEGLLQLQDLPSIGWAGSTPKDASTCVCVHMSVDPEKRLHITAVDPPPDASPDTLQRPLILFEGVCRLLAILETVEQFRALVDEPTYAVDDSKQTWRYGSTARFGGLVVGVPQRYLARETTVRRRLAIFLSLREVLDELPEIAADPLTTVAAYASAMRPHMATTPKPDNSRTVRLRADRLLARVGMPVKAAMGNTSLLESCSRWLKLDEEAKKLAPTPSELVFLKLTESPPVLLTSTGMFLQKGERRSKILANDTPA